jgi:hypothetical protein
MLKPLLYILFMIVGVVSVAQNTDSLLKQDKINLEGYWNEGNGWTLRYDTTLNFGRDYHKRIFTTAVGFNLIIKDGEIYMAWIDELGDESYVKIKTLTKHKLITVDEKGKESTYKRKSWLSSIL